jgi:hypothetical protein
VLLLIYCYIAILQLIVCGWKVSGVVTSGWSAVPSTVFSLEKPRFSSSYYYLGGLSLDEDSDTPTLYVACEYYVTLSYSRETAMYANVSASIQYIHSTCRPYVIIGFE